MRFKARYARGPSGSSRRREMKKMLVCIDDSEGSWKAIEYVGDQFAGVKDLEITLFHVLLGLPPEFWDDGHFLTEEEKLARKTVVDKWMANQKQILDPLFQKAVKTLVSQGILPEQIKSKFKSESIDAVDQCILTEARSGHYRMLVIGRCGQHSTKHFLLGSVTGRILNSGAGMAICVVG
jgi:nucleotide-binding universal stress UspA family protein